ncbi:MAG: hypothetical protein HZC28_18240 [Spirochaetes bacterium]|nr:hypothetical protein [Spirochaetota bacterium]
MTEQSSANIIVRIIDAMRRHMRAVIVTSCIVMAALIVLGIFVDKAHAHTEIEKLPAFWAVFGLAACIVIIVVSKLLGRIGVSKREDYYDK